MPKAKSTQHTIGHIYKSRYFPNITIYKKSFIWADNITVWKPFTFDLRKVPLVLTNWRMYSLRSTDVFRIFSYCPELLHRKFTWERCFLRDFCTSFGIMFFEVELRGKYTTIQKPVEPSNCLLLIIFPWQQIYRK